MSNVKRWYNDRYVDGWKLFEDSKPEDRFVSWKAFIEYVAANPGDQAHDHHWRSQFHQCRLCDIDYQYMLHLQNSEDEVDYILTKLGVENLTSVGTDSKCI